MIHAENRTHRSLRPTVLSPKGFSELSNIAENQAGWQKNPCFARSINFRERSHWAATPTCFGYQEVLGRETLGWREFRERDPRSRQVTGIIQAEKDEPQPQVVTALGLRMTNCAPQSLGIVDLGTDQILEAHWVDQQLHAVIFHHGIAVANASSKVKPY